MRLSRWFAAIVVMTGLGLLQVALRNGLILQSYAVGERTAKLHTHETETEWLSARVLGLTSPTHLAQVAQARRLNLVAWNTLSTASPQPTLLAQADGSPDE